MPTTESTRTRAGTPALPQGVRVPSLETRLAEPTGHLRCTLRDHNGLDVVQQAVRECQGQRSVDLQTGCHTTPMQAPSSAAAARSLLPSAE